MSEQREIRGKRMTGPQHYEAAEAQLYMSERCGSGVVGGWRLGIAQIHATLALAAATAMAGREMSPVDFDAWDAACGEPEPTVPDEED